MASSSDVEAGLREVVQVVRNTAFPGTAVYRGWPAAATFDAAAATGKAMVTVYPRDGFSRLTTRFPADPHDLARLPVTLTVTSSGVTATFAGVCSPDHIAGVQVGTTAWATRCVVGDTPAAVAQRLADASGGTASGATLTLPGLVVARTGRDGASVRVTRQQEMGFAVVVWTSDPVQRDQIAGAIDAALSDVEFLSLPDGSAARLTWAGERTTDKAENASLYRRDLYLTIEFSTTIRTAATPVLFQGTVIDAGGYRVVGALAPAAYVDVVGDTVLVDGAGNLLGVL